VKFHHVVQSNAIKSRLLKRGVEGADAYAVALAWDRAWNRPKGMRVVEEAREAHMAARLRELCAEPGNVLAIVPAPRLAGVVRALAASPN
jgi:pheromone shutdown protein TraB